MARFALMHLLGTAISLWLDTIVDEVIDDYVNRKLDEVNSTIAANLTDGFDDMLNQYDEPFYDHLIHSINCSKMAIVNNQSMSALPYFYPFTIEFNIAIASIWYMIWTNIGKQKINFVLIKITHFNYFCRQSKRQIAFSLGKTGNCRRRKR